MERGSGSAFESIESAHEYLALLTEVVNDAKKTIAAEIGNGRSNGSRRGDALQIASYNLDKLELHIGRSVRILNDLRSLRRLLFGERAQAQAKPRLVSAAVIDKPAPVFVTAPLSQMAAPKAGRKSVPAA